MNDDLVTVAVLDHGRIHGAGIRLAARRNAAHHPKRAVAEMQDVGDGIIPGVETGVAGPHSVVIDDHAELRAGSVGVPVFQGLRRADHWHD